jgi:tetratricopeptide (TPR) repeat protein
LEIAMSKVTDLDAIILRPKANASDAVSSTGSESARRIALLEFQELEQLIKSSPAEPLPYLQLAKIYRSLNRFKDTVRVLNAGVQFNPDYEPLVEMREDLLLESAIQMVEQAEKEHANQPSRDSELHRQRCKMQLANEQIRFARDRLKRHPEQHALRLLWAKGAVAVQEYEEAISQLDLAVKESTLRAEASLQLGQCLQALGKSLEALSSYRVAIYFRVPPPEKDIQLAAVRNGFQLAAELQLFDAAEQFAEKWTELEPMQAVAIKKRLEEVKKHLS